MQTVLSGGLAWGLRVGIDNRLPGDAEAAGTQRAFGRARNSCLSRKSPQLPGELGTSKSAHGHCSENRTVKHREDLQGGYLYCP